MPPIKGPPLKTQSSLTFRASKKAQFKPKFGESKFAIRRKDREGIQRMKYPTKIQKNLPSVKNYNNKKIEIKDEIKHEPCEDIKPSSLQFLGARKRRGEQQKYQLKLLSEERLPGMVWDMAVLDENIVVGTSEGAFMCSATLQDPQKLDNVIVSGGISVLSDGKIAIICRFMDTVNIFTQSGAFLKSFTAGFSPMCLAVNSMDELIVTDSGTKSVRIYSLDGKLQRTIHKQANGYTLRWPLYVTVDSQDNIIVADSHSQQILVFDPWGVYLRDFPLKTFGGNQVLRPHGLCINQDDVFVIDTAIDSMEVFLSDGTYLQTLLPSDEGVLFKPKAITCSPDSANILIGGLTGSVRIYQFMSSIKEESLCNIKEELKDPTDVIVLDD